MDPEATARAAGYVDAHGDALERALAGADGRPDAAALEAGLAARQREDGAVVFPESAAGDPIAGTLRALALLATAGTTRGAVARGAVGFAQRARNHAGGWSLGSGDGHAAHLATALLAGFLAQSPYARTRVLQESADWLATRWSPELVRAGDYAMIAGHAHFFGNYPHDATDGVLQWCGRELERGVRGGTLPALFALRVFSLCEAPVFPGTRLAAPPLLERLPAEQAADGGFLPGLPAPWRVSATLAALEASRRFGVPPGFAGTG